MSTATPPNRPRSKRPFWFRACRPRCAATTAQAATPKRKRTKATWGPGKRAEAALASTAITARSNDAPASASAAEAARWVTARVVAHYLACMAADAALFDIDGTLVDSVDLHARAWQETFVWFGKRVPFDAVRAQIGKGGDQL